MKNQLAKNMPVDNVFLDANILLAIILGRPNESSARQFIERHTGLFYISALSAHVIVHTGQTIVGLPVLRSFLSDYSVLSLEPTDFEWAFMNARNKDFEDALQLSVAIRNGCAESITFDKGLAADYKDLIPIKTRLLV